MRVPFLKEMRIGAYIFKQKMLGRKRYPLVLMLEPLFRCNLACVGCGKIDYPDSILNRRLSVQQCLDAVDECGAPMVAIPGGEPLIHREIGEIVKGMVREKEVRLAVHECAAAGEEAAPVRAVPLSVLLCPSGRTARASRQIGLSGRVCSTARSPRSRPPRPRASPSTSTPRSLTGMPRKTLPPFSTTPRSSASACRSRPATPMSARPTRSTS